MTVRGNGEIAGLIGLAVIGLFVYGLWVGGKSLWHALVGSTPAQVECHVDGREVYSGIAVDGVSGGTWSSKTLTDYATGRKIKLGAAATCVEREMTKAEAEKLRALWGK